MTKQKIVIANWKMELEVEESLELTKKYKNEITEEIIRDKEVIICPSNIVLKDVYNIIKDSPIRLGAQDVFWEEEGAYTGSISVDMLEEVGCKYVIIGHSERRQNLLENYQMINKKVKSVIEQGKITPIVCIGETLQEREADRASNIITEQLDQAMNEVHLLPGQQLVIAYEPIWAIGTGKIIEPTEAANMHGIIKTVLVDLFGISAVKNQIRIIYGGSVKDSNAANFSQLDSVDGFLVGGASLDAEEFKKIVEQV